MIVIGLDGGHFELIEPWINTLPNIKFIKDNGCWADMMSCLPPVTAPNWKCYSTGLNPGKLGIFYWELIDFKTHRVKLPNFFNTDFIEIWDYLNNASISTGIQGVPLTSPGLRRRLGYFVGGAPTVGTSNWFTPSNLSNSIVANKYTPNFINSIRINPEKAKPEILKKVEAEFELAKALITKYNPKFSHVTTYYLNELQHYTWDSPWTHKAWEYADKFLGWCLEQDQDIIVMSDHGSNKIEKVFNINTWLEKRGYLKLNNSTFTVLGKLGITKEKGAKILKYPALEAMVKAFMPPWVWDRIPLEEGNISGKSKEESINWEKSWAVASDQGPIYIKNNDSKLRGEIIEALLKEEEIVSNVHTREEIYRGEYLRLAPDLIIDQKPNIHICSGLAIKDIYSKAGTAWLAENKKTAMFMAYGKKVKTKGKINNINILDLAPTILNYHSLKVPEVLDGIVLREVF